MEEHSKMYEMLENHYKSIEQCKKCQSVDINSNAYMFLLDLVEVNVDFNDFGKISLLDEELLIVQSWINKVIGNHNISEKIREEIAISSVDFASMVESINNSHINTI